MITWSIKYCSHNLFLWSGETCIIDRNRVSEELLKLGGGQKTFIFRRNGLCLYAIFLKKICQNEIGKGQMVYNWEDIVIKW